LAHHPGVRIGIHLIGLRKVGYADAGRNLQTQVANEDWLGCCRQQTLKYLHTDSAIIQIKEDSQKIYEYYQKRGFNQAQVSYTIDRNRATGFSGLRRRKRK